MSGEIRLIQKLIGNNGRFVNARYFLRYKMISRLLPLLVIFGALCKYVYIVRLFPPSVPITIDRVSLSLSLFLSLVLFLSTFVHNPGHEMHDAVSRVEGVQRNLLRIIYKIMHGNIFLKMHVELWIKSHEILYIGILSAHWKRIWNLNTFRHFHINELNCKETLAFQRLLIFLIIIIIFRGRELKRETEVDLWGFRNFMISQRRLKLKFQHIHASRKYSSREIRVAVLGTSQNFNKTKRRLETRNTWKRLHCLEEETPLSTLFRLSFIILI